MDVGFNPETRRFDGRAIQFVNSGPLPVAEPVGLDIKTGKPVTVIEIPELNEDVDGETIAVDDINDVTEVIDLNAETAIDEAAATGGSVIDEEKLPTLEEVKAKIDADAAIAKEQEVEINTDEATKINTKIDKKAKAEAKSAAARAAQTEGIVLIEDGSKVTAYLDGEPAEGVIKSSKVVDGVAIYQVEIEGEVHELTEDDVEK
jgi:hypothetical protein